MRLPELRRRGAAVAARLEERPAWHVLGALVVFQWFAVAALVLSVRHNGWLFFQGGDQTWLYSGAYALSSGEIPAAYVGYGWSYLLAPLAWVAGPSFFAALPGIVLFQQLALVPIAVLSIYGIVASLGGRRLGYLGVAVWIAAPFAVIPLFDPRYHERYVEQLLPQALGLTGMADFPSMVLLLAAAYFIIHSLDTRDELEIALGGILVGFAIGMKPSNAVFLAAPLLALVLARRSTSLVVLSLALVPALTTLALWKYRGLGYLPVLGADGGTRIALGLGDLPVGSLRIDLGRYVDVDWGKIGSELDQIREYFYSVRALEWLPLAGTLAVARRSVPKAAFLAAWLFAFLAFKGTSPQATVESGSFWRFVMPGFPPLLLYAAALPLLIPAARLRVPAVARLFRGRRRSQAFAAAVALCALGPAVLIAASDVVEGPSVMVHVTEGSMLPAEESWRPRLGPGNGIVRLTWRQPAAGSSHPYYVIYRVRRDADTRCYPLGDSLSSCTFDSDQMYFTRERKLVDRPPDGIWTYRIGLAANWRDLPNFGDVVLLSAPVTVSVPDRH